MTQRGRTKRRNGFGCLINLNCCVTKPIVPPWMFKFSSSVEIWLTPGGLSQSVQLVLSVIIELAARTRGEPDFRRLIFATKAFYSPVIIAREPKTVYRGHLSVVDTRSLIITSERLSVGGTYKIKRNNEIPGRFVERADIYVKRAEIDNFPILSNDILFRRKRPFQSTLSSSYSAAKFVFDRLFLQTNRPPLQTPGSQSNTVYAYWSFWKRFGYAVLSSALTPD